jgi:hypothetical protein
MKHNGSKDSTAPSIDAGKVKRRLKYAKWLPPLHQIIARLDEARGERTLEEVAIASGVAVSIIQRCEVGDQLPNLGLLAYYGSTGFSIDTLLLGQKAEPNLEYLQSQVLALPREDQMRLVAFVLSRQQQSQGQ